MFFFLFAICNLHIIFTIIWKSWLIFFISFCICYHCVYYMCCYLINICAVFPLYFSSKVQFKHSFLNDFSSLTVALVFFYLLHYISCILIHAVTRWTFCDVSSIVNFSEKWLILRYKQNNVKIVEETFIVTINVNRNTCDLFIWPKENNFKNMWYMHVQS